MQWASRSIRDDGNDENDNNDDDDDDSNQGLTWLPPLSHLAPTLVNTSRHLWRHCPLRRWS